MMVKAEIVKFIAEEFNLPDDKAMILVTDVFDCVIDYFMEKDRLEIRDFGVFTLTERKERIGRNPRNSEAHLIPKREVIKFKGGKILRSITPEDIQDPDFTNKEIEHSEDEGDTDSKKSKKKKKEN